MIAVLLYWRLPAIRWIYGVMTTTNLGQSPSELQHSLLSRQGLSHTLIITKGAT